MEFSFSHELPLIKHEFLIHLFLNNSCLILAPLRYASVTLRDAERVAIRV